MRVLILKLTSLGDVVHTLPAVTDACQAMPDLQFDWVVDRSLSEIPAWHEAVDQVLALPMRSWRRTPWNILVRDELPQFIRTLQERSYDLIIDAQGQLGKTIWIAHLADGLRCGMDWSSAREPLASWHYHRKFNIPKNQHAVERVRQLFAASLGYSVPQAMGDYGIDREKGFQVRINPQRLVFLHGTTWTTKHYPEAYWKTLIHKARLHDFEVLMTWGNPEERERANRLADQQPHVVVHPKSNLTDFAREMASAAGVVTVDTGLGHLAAALDIPTVSLYGPTSTGLTGAYGRHQSHLEAKFPCAPCFRKRCNYREPSQVKPACFEQLNPDHAWKALMSLVSQPALR